MLLNTLQCIGQPPQWRIIQFAISVVLKWRKSVLGTEEITVNQTISFGFFILARGRESKARNISQRDDITNFTHLRNIPNIPPTYLSAWTWVGRFFKNWELVDCLSLVLYFILIFKTETFILASQSLLARTVTILLRLIFSVVVSIPYTLAFSKGMLCLTVMVCKSIFQSEVNMKFGEDLGAVHSFLQDVVCWDPVG